MTTTRKNPRILLATSLRRTAMSAGLLATLLLTTSCTATSQESVVDVIEQRDAVVKFVIDTTEVLDIDGWKASHGAARAQACTLDNGDEGAAYQFTLWAEPGTEHQENAQRIVKYWESLGMETRVVDHGGYPAVYPTGGPVQRASFATNAAEDHYQVGASAYCAPGDAAKLKTEFNKRRKNGERFPGNEYVPKENVSEEHK